MISKVTTKRKCYRPADGPDFDRKVKNHVISQN